jgi:hypothetical protein
VLTAIKGIRQPVAPQHWSAGGFDSASHFRTSCGCCAAQLTAINAPEMNDVCAPNPRHQLTSINRHSVAGLEDSH